MNGLEKTEPKDFRQTISNLESMIKDDPVCVGECEKVEKDSVISLENHREDCRGAILYRKKLLKACGVSKRDIEVLTVPLRATKSLLHIKQYEKNEYNGGGACILSGGTGAGKTIAANYIFLNNGFCGMSVYAPDLQKIFLDDEKFNKIKFVYFLILDDIGIEYKKDWFNSNFDSLINHRHGEKLATIITTNLSSEEFKNTYSERVISRLRNWGSFYQLKDKDLRGKK